MCTASHDAGFMLVCTKGVRADDFEVELLPCAHCNAKTPGGAQLGVVDFNVSACRLPELPVYDAGSPSDVVTEEPDAGFVDESDAGSADAGEVGEVGDVGDVGDVGGVDAGVEEFKPCPCEDEGFRCDDDLGVCVHAD